MNKGKKILFLVTQSEFGGAQRFIYTLVTALLRRNTQIEFAVAAGREGDDEKGLLFQLEKKGINTRHLRYLRRSINPLFDFLGTIEIYRLIKKEKPDVLFLNCSKAGMLGGLAGRILKLPSIIYRIGGWTFNDPWPKWKKKIYIWIEKYTAKLKDVIINNAKSDTEQAIKLGIKPRKKIVTISNGVDINGLEFLSKEDARKFLQVEDSDFIVGTIANDYPAKGLKYLIEASKKLQNIKFVIIGKGNRFIPDAYKYLKAFDAFVLPSVKEGFPWTVLEAMSAEIPVVVTRVGAVPDIIENGENGLLIDPGKSEQIVEAIEKLLGDENLRKNMAEAGKKTVVDKFSLDKMMSEYIKLFESTN